MSGRDLASELAADNAVKELAALRALRDAVQEVGRALTEEEPALKLLGERINLAETRHRVATRKHGRSV